MKPTNDDLKWIGIDYDNTIAKNSGYPDFTPLDPLEDTKESIVLLASRGYKPTIYTARPSSDVFMLEEWLKKYDIEHSIRRLFTGKELFRHMIDDRAIRFTNWKETIELIKKIDQNTPFWK